MAKERQAQGAPPDSVISIIGPGMKVVGDCTTDGTIRVEGSVEGSIRAGKAVVVGKNGFVDGDIVTQDAVISGRVKGSLTAESRLELQSTSRIDGQVVARMMQLEEGGVLNGTVQMGEKVGARTEKDQTPAKVQTPAQGGEKPGAGARETPSPAQGTPKAPEDQ
jgi:cytoskeletal protein CcmA (bactofilin family)